MANETVIVTPEPTSTSEPLPPAGTPAPEKTFTQAEIDAILAERLAKANENASAERQRYEQALADERAQGQALFNQLNQLGAEVKKLQTGQRPALSPDQQVVAEATAPAMQKLESKMDEFMTAVGRAVGPVIARDACEDFLAQKAAQVKLPDAVKMLTRQALRANPGAAPEVAYNWALARYMENQLINPAPVSPPAPAAQPRPPVPHVETGGAARSLLPGTPGAQQLDWRSKMSEGNDDLKTKPSWVNFRKEMEGLSRSAPADGVGPGDFEPSQVR